MIRLTRSTLRDDLRTRLAQWETEYKQLLRSGDEIPKTLRDRYKDPEIKATLKADTSEKCGYCESKVTAVYPGDVEHIAPRAARPELALSYENLTFSCFECNNAKGAYYSETDPLINPYVDDPSDHLIAFGGIVLIRDGSKRGRLTQTRMALNRPELVERRIERLKALGSLIYEMECEAPGPLRDTLREALLTEAADSTEYSFMSRALFAGHKLESGAQSAGGAQ